MSHHITALEYENGAQNQAVWDTDGSATRCQDEGKRHHAQCVGCRLSPAGDAYKHGALLPRTPIGRKANP